MTADTTLPNDHNNQTVHVQPIPLIMTEVREGGTSLSESPPLSLSSSSSSFPSPPQPQPSCFRNDTMEDIVMEEDAQHQEGNNTNSNDNDTMSRDNAAMTIYYFVRYRWYRKQLTSILKELVQFEVTEKHIELLNKITP